MSVNDPRKGTQNTHGGKRAGAGRKPKALTLLKRELIKERGEQAQYALDLFISVMHDESRKDDIRMAAAREVMDRVLGKPTQMSGNPGNELYQAHLAKIRAVIFKEEQKADVQPIAVNDS